ncbi:unnamed protein product [Hymenolepis diminuta]|uniref:Uncharacterized protein n=1 Tax=Hymenolepis diminuta TaxID=6216 RepID=A0A0R3SZK6_HYMDI|nr:unnamed protein product [Hymenolepis diminuta]
MWDEKRARASSLRHLLPVTLPSFELGTFCVLGRRDNHYTTGSRPRSSLPQLITLFAQLSLHDEHQCPSV